jgi:SAM-dependent methyltransferase
VTWDRASHWDAVYGAKAEDAVSWFQASADTSLQLLAESGLDGPCRVVDVGGGASRLVDALVERAGTEVTVLDVAAEGLEHARRRLGEHAQEVRWVVADVTRWQPGQAYDIWHDRAVFHFLVDADDREQYCRVLRAAVRPGGSVIVATFAEDGPDTCSGLPVVRYDVDALTDALGGGLETVSSRRQLHRTPGGGQQPFTWLLARRV